VKPQTQKRLNNLSSTGFAYSYVRFRSAPFEYYLLSAEYVVF